MSVRPRGSDELRTRTETKNINSINSLGRAIAYEAKRHIDLYDAGERPIQETRHWDEEAGRTKPGRSKENEEDYRYFPEPDLTPLVPSEQDIADIDAALPELPREKVQRLEEALGFYAADFHLIVEREQTELAIAANSIAKDGPTVASWTLNQLSGGSGQLRGQEFGQLLKMREDGSLSSNQAVEVLAEMVTNGGYPADIAAAKGFEAMDTGELDAMVDELIANHPDEWARYCGDDPGESKKMAGFFTGQIMKATKGQADGKVVAQLLNSHK